MAKKKKTGGASEREEPYDPRMGKAIEILRDLLRSWKLPEKSRAASARHHHTAVTTSP